MYYKKTLLDFFHQQQLILRHYQIQFGEYLAHLHLFYNYTINIILSIINIIYKKETTCCRKSFLIIYYVKTNYYSIILSTTPAPTVLPPSRIANLIPSSIATGAISSTFITTLSPGITISPSNWIEPVTSVVLM